MKILACDTAIGTGSVCLYDGGVVALIRTEEMHKQAEKLIPNIEAILAEAGWKYSDLDLLATTIGAGSFTGVRIGLAAIRGIALASGLKVVGVTTLQAIAYGEGECLAILNAGRGQVYAQKFDENSVPIYDIKLMDYDAIPEGVKIVGNLDIDGVLYKEPDAVAVARYAFANADLAKNGVEISPVYVRQPDAIPQKK